MDYLLAFLLGAFLANSIPHITNGVSGRRFHTPFASPPGKGFSSPVVNVVWGSANLLIAAGVYHLGLEDRVEPTPMGMVFAGFALTLVTLAWWFGRINDDHG